MRTLTLLILVGVLAAGCDKHSLRLPTKVDVTTARYSWLGTYTSGSEQGTVAIDVNRAGLGLTGLITFNTSGSHVYRLSGTMVLDSMDLHLDPAVFPNSNDFTLRGRVHADGSMAGHMALAYPAFDAGVSCRALPRLDVIDHTERTMALPVIAIAYDGAQLWLSNASGNYALMNVDGTVTGYVTIPHAPNALWVSSVLGFDGARMWGVYPISMGTPGGGNVNVADLLGFTAAGRTPDSLRIGHRPGGFAYDGSNMWSLRGSPSALVRLDATGVVTDSLDVAIPDANQLAFDGTHFWTVGWFIRRLYELDTNGQVLAFCDIPGTSLANLTAGLTAEGTHLWYAEGWIGTTTLHRLTVQ